MADETDDPETLPYDEVDLHVMAVMAAKENDDEFDFDAECQRLNAIKAKNAVVPPADADSRHEDKDPEVAEILDRIDRLHVLANTAKARGEIWWHQELATWCCQVAADEDVARCAKGFGEDSSSPLVDAFQSRGCVSKLAVPTPDVLISLDEISRTNPHLSGLVSLVRLHTSASIKMQRPVRLPHVLLVGEPGVGKTHVVKAIARALSLPMTILDGPALTGAGVFSGTDSSWKRPRIGKIAEGLLRHDVANQVVVIDEIDKTHEMPGYSDQLDPLHAALEPSSALDWRDEYLGVSLDASWLTMIATANSIDGIAPSLLSRFQIINVEKPDRDQLRKVIRSIAKSLAADHGDFFQTPAISDDVIEILAVGGTPRSARQTLSMALIHAASSGRRQVIPADLIAVAAMTMRLDKSQGRIGFIR